VSASLVQRIMRELYSPPAWLLPFESIEFLVTIDDWHDALDITACHNAVEESALHYETDRIDGRLLRAYAARRYALVNVIKELMDNLIAKLEPKHCRHHDDCRACRELAEACWTSTQRHGEEP
jgi:hypothetical protein